MKCNVIRPRMTERCNKTLNTHQDPTSLTSWHTTSRPQTDDRATKVTAHELPWLVLGTGSMASLTLAAARTAGIPIGIAGRNQSAVARLAALHQVPARYGTGSPNEDRTLLNNIRGVVNAVGPYTGTAEPLMHNCLRAGVHYVDFSNEMATHLQAWSLTVDAQQAGITIVPGAGFGTVAAEFIGDYLLSKLASSTHLEVVLIRGRSNRRRTPGIGTSAQHILAHPPKQSRYGQLDLLSAWHGAEICMSLPKGSRTIIPIANGDLVALSKSTSLDTVTVYTTTSAPSWIVNPSLPLLRWRTRRSLRNHENPDPKPALKQALEAKGAEPSQVWAQVTDPNDQRTAAIIQTPSGSKFAAHTAISAIHALNRGEASGSVMSAFQLVGRRAVLDIPGTTITDEAS